MIALFLFFLFCMQLVEAQTGSFLTRGQYNEKEIFLPQLNLNDICFGRSSEKWTVWLCGKLGSSGLFSFRANGNTGNYSSSSLINSDFNSPIVTEDILGFMGSDLNNGVRGVWYSDLNSGVVKRLLSENELINATIKPSGAIGEFSLMARVDAIFSSLAREYVSLRLETQSRSRYSGVFRFDGQTFRQVFLLQGVNHMLVDLRLWTNINNPNRIFFKESENNIVRLSSFDSLTNIKTVLLDGSQPILGEQTSLWTLSEDSKLENFYITYAVKPSIPSSPPPFERLASVNSLGEKQRIYSVEDPIEEFGRPYSIQWIVATGSKFVIVGLKSAPPVGVPDMLAIWDGETMKPFLRTGDNVFGKPIDRFIYPAAYGCTAEIPLVYADNTFDIAKLQRPCVLQSPTSASAGDTVTLEGKNLFLSGANRVSVFVNEIEVPVLNGFSVTSVRFTMPSVTAGNVKVKVKQIFPNGSVVTSNPVTIQVLGPPPPAIREVVNGASFGPGISPCYLATIYGTNLTQKDGKFSSLPLPVELEGVRVLVDGNPAGMVYVSSGQINFQVPCELGAPAQVRVQVVRNGVASAEMRINILPESPAVFTYQDYGIVTDENYRLVGNDNEALTRGQSYTLWLTGCGRVNQFVQTGQSSPASPLAETLETPKLSFDGEEALVHFSGLSPGLVGVCQINFTMPGQGSGMNPYRVQGRITFGSASTEFNTKSN